MTERIDPYHSVARELLAVLEEAARPMSLRELQASGRMPAPEAARQLSIARVAGFVRSVPAPDRRLEPCYQPTAMGRMIARRTSYAVLAARQLRRAA
jgi:DNA-binding IclR family transcriptional regulator